MNFAPPKNYLFMLPDMITPAEQDEVVEVARALLTDGYVYIFSARETSVVDRGDIRYLPLRTESMPYFGEVSGVLVARDRQLAKVARETYPGAAVMVFDPGQPLEIVSGNPEPVVDRLTWRPAADTASEPLLQAA